MGANNGTGWPITVRCSKCKAGRDWRNSRDDGTRLVRTGLTRPYHGGNLGARGIDTFHQYRCLDCKHVGWSRHVDITRKALETDGGAAWDRLSSKEIGERINKHLKRFEADPGINLDRSPNGTGLHTYYNAGARGYRAHVYVSYVSFQGQRALKRADALKYLMWLDAGNVGRHYKALEGR
jgi:hypothetical protein